MNFQGNFYAVLVFLGFSLVTVSCLRCHVCNTINPGEEDCEMLEQSSTKFLANCTAPHDQSCRTQDQWVDFSVLDQQHEKRTVRQCASTVFDPAKPCYYRTGFGGKVNVCNCIGDGCNEASRTVSTVLLSIALILLVRLIS